MDDEILDGTQNSLQLTPSGKNFFNIGGSKVCCWSATSWHRLTTAGTLYSFSWGTPEGRIEGHALWCSTPSSGCSCSVRIVLPNSWFREIGTATCQDCVCHGKILRKPLFSKPMVSVYVHHFLHKLFWTRVVLWKMCPLRVKLITLWAELTCVSSRTLCWIYQQLGGHFMIPHRYTWVLARS